MDEIFIGDIACALALFFLFGTVAADRHWNYIAMLILFGIVAVGTIIYRLKLYKICIAGFLGLLIGTAYYSIYITVAAGHRKIPFDKSISLTGIIDAEPSPSSGGVLLSLDTRPPFAGELLVFTPSADALRYGDRIKVSGAVDPPDGPWDDPFLFSRTAILIDRNNGSALRGALIGLKEAFLQKFDQVLPPDQAALLGGIAFGTKENFTPELKQDMALAGLTHMVAISGYNITIIIVSAGWMFKGFFSRRITLFITMAFIILFILMSGISASAIRAAIMGCIGLISRETGRSYDIRNSIVFTAAAMAIQDPTIIMHNAGFQLSFLSLVGIVYFEAPLKKLFEYNSPGFLQWKESALTTFSAQLGVMPVLIATFGVFSLTSIGANVLVLGTIPLTMLFGFILAPLGFLSKSLAIFAGKIAGLFLAYQLFVIKLFSRFAVPLPFGFTNTLSIILYYGFLIIFTRIYADREK